MNTINVMEFDGEQIDDVIAGVIKDACDIVFWCNADNGLIKKNSNNQVNVYLLSDDEIKEINKKHRGIDEPTDVLSFPLDIDDPDSGSNILGEILISRQMAEKQAVMIGHSYEREAAFLCVHGLLHLLDHDHENEEDESLMIKRQKEAVDIIERDILDQDKFIKRVIRKLDGLKVNAYAPYSGICVTAAVITQDNRIFYGVNVENSSYGATSCAERNAVGAAVLAGADLFKMIIIASSLDELIYPCGICRQIIGEFTLPWTKIIVTKPDGQYVSYRYEELMPHGFEIKNRRNK